MTKKIKTEFNLGNLINGPFQIILSYLDIFVLSQLSCISKEFYQAINYQYKIRKPQYDEIFKIDHGVEAQNEGKQPTLSYKIKKWPCEKLFLKLISIKAYNPSSFGDIILFSVVNDYDELCNFLLDKKLVKPGNVAHSAFVKIIIKHKINIIKKFCKIKFSDDHIQYLLRVSKHGGFLDVIKLILLSNKHIIVSPGLMTELIGDRAGIIYPKIYKFLLE